MRGRTQRKKRMKPLTKVITAVVAIIFIVSACAVDSDSLLPLKVMAASMLYLVVVGARYGIFEESGDY